MRKFLFNITEWIGDDFRSHPLRFCIEILAWSMSIGANIMFAFTVPHVPFVLYLSITITGCALYAWSAYSRRSFGMLANYMFLTALDSFALWRVFLA
jgi:hypothetical protein